MCWCIYLRVSGKDEHGFSIQLDGITCKLQRFTQQCFRRLNFRRLMHWIFYGFSALEQISLMEVSPEEKTQ